MRLVLIPFTLAAVLTGTPLIASDLSVFAGAALTFDNARLPAGNPSTHGHGTDANVYIEGEFHHVYGGISADILNNSDFDVLDLYLGYRNSMASGLGYDLSFDQSTYPNDRASDYGTLALSIGMPVGNRLTVGFNGDYYPNSQTSDGYLRAVYTLSDKITLTAKMGLIGNGTGSGGAAKDFELAAAYQLGEKKPQSNCTITMATPTRAISRWT